MKRRADLSALFAKLAVAVTPKRRRALRIAVANQVNRPRPNRLTLAQLSRQRESLRHNALA